MKFLCDSCKNSTSLYVKSLLPCPLSSLLFSCEVKGGTVGLEVELFLV